MPGFAASQPAIRVAAGSAIRAGPRAPIRLFGLFDCAPRRVDCLTVSPMRIPLSIAAG